MHERSTVIQNEAGIHVRPSGVIINRIKEYPGTVSLVAKGMEMELGTVMALLALGLTQGDEVVVRVDGPQEEKTLEELCDLFATNFDFPPRE